MAGVYRQTQLERPIFITFTLGQSAFDHLASIHILILILYRVPVILVMVSDRFFPCPRIARPNTFSTDNRGARYRF
jgi:hypothetical protein